jgi:hypothetical protein
MKLLPLYLLLLLCISCNKHKNDRRVAVKKKLDASWGLCCTGTDVNKNNLIDENERTPKSVDDDLRITMKGDGTGKWYIRYQGKSLNLNATWNLGDTTDLAIYISGYDSFYYTIQNVNDKELTVIEDGVKGTPPPYTVFKRE